jgi:hypothetical protein
MSTIVVIIILLLLFGGFGGGYYGYSRWGSRGGNGNCRTCYFDLSFCCGYLVEESSIDLR